MRYMTLVDVEIPPDPMLQGIALSRLCGKIQGAVTENTAMAARREQR